jgi:hypothetical protein
VTAGTLVAASHQQAVVDLRQPNDQPDSARGGERWRPPAVNHLDQRVEIIDLELARDIRSTETELSGA